MKHARTALTMQRAILLLFLIPAAPAAAVQYQISYEANTPGSFPEDEGWTRTFGSGGATRSIEGGAFVLATEPDDITVFDIYRIHMGGNLDPDPGEMFFAEWRLRVDANSHPDFGDPGVTIARDSTGGPFGGADVSFRFFPNRVVETQSETEASFEPGLFHLFRFESEDMDNYRFYIDGDLSFTGVFDSPSTNMSFVVFGDALDGVASTSRWDYVRFGVVPEPSSAFPMVVWIFLLTRRRPAQC